MTEWCACAADTMVDDAGNPGCVNYTQCIIDCFNVGVPDAGIDAGSATGCVAWCAGMPQWTMAEQMTGNTFLACLQTSCQTSIDGGPPACQ
jgi:hypothetical protein